MNKPEMYKRLNAWVLDVANLIAKWKVDGEPCWRDNDMILLNRFSSIIKDWEPLDSFDREFKETCEHFLEAYLPKYVVIWGRMSIEQFIPHFTEFRKTFEDWMNLSNPGAKMNKPAMKEEKIVDLPTTMKIVFEFSKGDIIDLLMTMMPKLPMGHIFTFYEDQHDRGLLTIDRDDRNWHSLCLGDLLPFYPGLGEFVCHKIKKQYWKIENGLPKNSQNMYVFTIELC